jgi:signal transduction histidine kinase/DNA-binding response OmpR family regulator
VIEPLPTLLERIDFSQTPLGPRESWPQALRSSLSICLSSKFPMLIWWGPELCMLYNDAYAPILGNKHPAAYGMPGEVVWRDIWPVIGPMLRGVLEGGEATWSEDELLVMNRTGFTEETYFTWSFSPIPDEAGGIAGVFTATHETTSRVLGERRLDTLRLLGEQVAHATETVAACTRASEALGTIPRCVPFSLLYLLDADGGGARLAGTSGVAAGLPVSPLHVPLDQPGGWPLALVARTRDDIVVDDLVTRFGSLSAGAWPEPIERAVLLPIAARDTQQPMGVLVVGISPRLALDAAYRNFLRLATSQIASALASARTSEEERARTAALAEIDRAKTAFFSNISHELRTPLTLMLGPLEDALASGKLAGEALAIAHRNSVRLLQLVNALLDFSRIEAGRADGSFEPTDLAALTRELAAAFEPALESAGLRFEIDAAALSEPVYVDPSMWEKIVLNLLSNAFKFTFEGGIRVALATVDGAAQLTVSDTGIGVSAEELPRLFERFHRIEGARSRTHEGSGIGLALVHELVRLNGGTITADSTPGKGSIFTVRIPLGFAHLPQDQIHASRGHTPRSLPAQVFGEDAARWLPHSEDAAPVPSRRTARVLVADDNADMRAYLQRVLEPHWIVETVADGAAALASVRATRPDVIVSDVMMPELDGFGLLHALRADPALEEIPVIFLSARAGDGARAVGIEAGADDYIVKPFSARELIARVSMQMELSTLRTDAATIQRISSMLAAELDLDKLVKLVTDEATTLMGGEFGALFYNVIDANNESYTLYTLSGVPREAFSKFPMPRNTQVFAPTFRGDKGVIRMDDVTKDPRYGHNAPYKGMPEGHLPVKSYLAAPVVARSGEVIGGLFFGHSQAGVFTPRTERILEAIAAQAAVAIDNARLYDRVSDLLDSERSARRTSEEANRAKDEFLAVLGHELRNPLAPILTALQLMELKGERRSKERDVIERQVGHLVRLVDDLLDVSRITRGMIDLTKAKLELGDIVGEALEMASPLIEQKRHHLSVDVPRADLLVEVDRGRMAQVVSNLLTNAAKYTPPDGELHISARRDGDSVVLAVRDNGIGISADTIGRVFEPFVQDKQALDRARGGLGLGLTIVRTFVEMHGGRVTAVSDGVGCGSTFSVHLPAAMPVEVAAALLVDPLVPGAKIHARRVLVVNDNVDAADLVVATLSALGHQAVAAHDGPSALGLASSLRPHVAILDIGLPVMDGYELARRIRALPELHDMRLVALPGYGTDSDRARSLEAGFDEHLVKPLKLERLEAVLEASAR